MDRNNAFKTSLLFLGIILIAIIVRAYLVSGSIGDGAFSAAQMASPGCNPQIFSKCS